MRMLVEAAPAADVEDEEPVVLPDTLGISWAFNMVVCSKQLQQYLSHRSNRMSPPSSQTSTPGQECTAQAEKSTTLSSRQRPQSTGLTLMTLPVYWGIMPIIRATMSTPMAPVNAAGAQCSTSPATHRAMPNPMTIMENIVTRHELTVGTRTLRSKGPAVVT